MNYHPYSRVLNFAWYQLTWFAAVLGGAAYEWFLGILLLMHLGLVGTWGREIALMIAVAALGCSVDALLAMAGYFQFDGESWLPIPLWHVAIWVGFAGTLRHSMTFMVQRPRLMTIAAALFAPLTYLAAQRLGAVVFPLGSFPTAIVISLCWLTVTPLLIWLTSMANGHVLRPMPPGPYPLTTQEESS
ncbi:MAG: DUF2878 domain-containing protein [Pseudomonadota bacterium]